MASFDFIAELRKTLPPSEIRTLITRLKADPQVWNSLADEGFFKQASAVGGMTFKNWSPAILGLAAVRPGLSPEGLTADLSKGPEDAILQSSLKLFQETRRTGRQPRSLAEAAMLALALRQHWKLDHTWKGLYNQLAAAGGEPDWKHFKIWRTPIACLYGMVPDPLDMLRGLQTKRYSPVGTAWIIHALASNPLSDLEFSQGLYNLIVTLPPLQQVSWLRAVKGQGYDSLVEMLARQVLARVPAVVTSSLSSVETAGQDLESLFLRFLEMQRLAGLYRFANQPANARALIRRSQKALKYCEAGLELQDIDLGGMVGERPAEEFGETLSSQIGSYNDLQQELVFASDSHNGLQELDSLLADTNPSPFVQIKKASRLLQDGKKAEAVLLVRSAFGAIVSLLGEAPYAFLPIFVYDWHPRQFVQVFFDLGLATEGLQLTDLFIAMRPEDTDLQYQASLAYEQGGEIERALAGTQVLAALEPESAEWRRRLGALYTRNEDWAAAYAERKAALELAAPAQAEDWVSYAFCASKLGDWDEVLRGGEKALEIHAENGMAYALIGQVKQQRGEMEEAGRLFLQSTLLSPDEAYGWLCLAAYHEQAGNIEKSLETMRAAVLSIPESSEVNFTLAKACLRLGYLADGLPYLRKAAELAPESLDTSFELGKTLLALGRLDEAEHVLRHAHLKWPRNFNLAFAYAQAALATGDCKNALPALEIAIQKENPPAEWLIVYAETMVERSSCAVRDPVASSNGLANAFQALAEAITQDPANFKAHLLTAEVLAAQGALDEANTAYNRLQEFPEASSTSYRWRLQAGIGKLALQQGQVGKALAALQEAITDQSENVSLHRLLAEAYRAGSLNEDALRTGRETLKLAPAALDNLVWYADFMISLHEPADALYALNCATQLEPSIPANWLRLARLQGELGDATASIASLERLLQVPVLQAADFRGAAAIYWNGGQGELALDCLKRAVHEVQEPGITTLLEAAFLYQRAGQAEAGLEMVQRALILVSDDPALYALQADFLVLLERPEAGLACLEHSQHLAEGTSTTAAHWSEPSEILDAAWVAGLVDAAGMHFRMASLYRQAGDPSAAYQHIQTAYDLHPDWVSLKTMAGDLAVALLLATQAADYITETAEAADPLAVLVPSQGGAAELWAIRAELALETGAADAGELIAKGAALQPEHPRLLAARATWNYAHGHFGEAEQDYRAAVLNHNHTRNFAYDHSTASYWLLKAAVETWQWEAAALLGESLVNQYPNEPYAHLLLAQSLAVSAETQRLLAELQATSHLPGEASLGDARCDQFERAIQNASRLSSGASIELWKLVGRTSFRPTTQNIRNLAGLLPSPLVAETLAAALRRGNNLAGSVQVAEQYLDCLPVKMQLALSYLQMDAGRGLELIHEVSEQRPWDALALVIKFNLAEKQQEIQEAFTALERALQIWTEEPLWHARAGELASLLGERSKSVLHWEHAAALNADYFPYSLALGSAYLVNGQPEQAIAVLEKSLPVEPERADGWHLLAQAYRLAQKYDDALRCAVHTGQLQPGEVEPQLLCGEICLEIGRLPEALGYALEAWNADPDNEAALRFYVQVLVRSGKREEALKILDQVAGGEMTLPVALERARLVKELRGSLEAFVILQKLVLAYPDNLDVMVMLAQAQAENGDDSGAETTAVAALALQPDHAALNQLVGKIYKKAGNLDKAVHFLSQAIRKEPGSLESYLELAGVYLSRREPQQALQIFQKAITVDPLDYRAYYQAAQVLRDGRDYLGAETMLRRAVDLAPEDVTIRRQLGAVITLNLIHNSQEATTSHESYWASK